MSNHFCIQRYPSYVGSATRPEYLRKDWCKASPVGYTYGLVFNLGVTTPMGLFGILLGVARASDKKIHDYLHIFIFHI